jgi:hypothetical protein
VRLDTLRGIPANLAPRTVGFAPNPRTFGNGMGKLSSQGAAYRVFGFTLQGLNQSIVGLSPLPETA